VSENSIAEGKPNLMQALARVIPSSRVRMLELTREYLAHREDFLAACDRVLSKGQLLGGEELNAFEAELASLVGTTHAKGVASGTDALRLAARAAGLRPGDDVLLQANAFVADVEALYDNRIVPVPVDIAEDDLGPDPAALAAAVTPRTRGILVVHLHGVPADMHPILEVARAHRLIVVEDCSHAHGATLDGRHVGTFGTVGAFSLGPIKNLGAYGDAGFVGTNDAEIAQRVKLLGTHGQVKKNEHALYGGNSRLDEMQAALLRVKLRHLGARNARRRAIAEHYCERFYGLVGLPLRDDRRVNAYHQFVIRTQRRDALQKHLAAHDVETGVHYPVPIHRQPAWLRTYGDAPSLPRAERVAGEMLSLPVHPDLTDAEVERVADAVTSFFS
jgi:dTDP-4-amino-4,6-dideoxygalactose transaminase